jgi:purine-binding chemotaxis protein CheW
VKALPRGRSEAQRTFVGFSVAEIAYALDVMYVVQIINPGAVDPLPYMPHAVVGVSDFRGTVVPVIDLRIRLGAPQEQEQRAKWLIVRSGPAMGALVVDEVHDVFSVPVPEIRPPPRSGDEELRALSGVLQHRKRMTFVLDLAKLQPLLEAAEHQPSALFEQSIAPRDDGKRRGKP